MESELAPISKEYWMPDASTRTCCACEKPFTVLIRKHHCRGCGLIYCSECCDFVKNGKETSRMCTKCQRPLSVSAASQEAVTALLESAGNLTVNSVPGTQVPIQLLDSGSPLLASEPKSAFIQYCDDLLSLECDRLVADFAITAEWKPLIVSFVKQAVECISLETHPRGDEMDINKYLRVVKLLHKDTSLSEYFNGVAFLKNIAHKKMKVKIPNPTILLLSGGAEFSSGEERLLSMESILDQEPDFTKLFMRKLAKLKPQLVIVEKSMSQWIISELARFGVAAIINVQTKLLQLIARMTQGKPLSDIDQATQVKNCIGHCSEMVIKPYQRSGVVYLRTCSETALVGSIVLTGPDMDMLGMVKKVVRELCVKYRNWRLECSLLNQLRIKPIARLSEEISSTSLMLHHLRVFGKMCQKPKVLALQLYSNCDKPIGLWVTETLSNLDMPCSGCDSKHALHYDYYLKREGLVKIQYLSGGGSSGDITVKIKCMLCVWEGLEVQLNEWSYEMSFFRFLACFFIDERNEKLPCGHSLFRAAAFTFSTPTSKVCFEYFSKPLYTVLPIKPKIVLSNYYTSLAAKVISEAQSASKDLYQKLLQEAAQVKADIAQLDVESEEELQGVEALKLDVNTTYDELIASLTHCEETIELEGLLEAEYVRRELFLDICKHKVTIQTHKQSFKSLKSGKRFISPSRMTDWLNLIPTTPELDRDLEPEDLPQRRSREDPGPLSRSDSTVMVPRTWLLLEKSDPIVTADSFELMQVGGHTLAAGPNNTFTPVRINDPLSVISYILNSPKHRDEVTHIFQHSTDIHEIIESELLSGSEFALESTFSTSNFPEVDAQNDLIRIYGQAVTFHATAYYARQFQAVRLFLCGSERDFLQSIIYSTAEQANLGKSGARFFKTHDEQFIAKIVEEKEFQMFVDMAPNYFRHICKTFYHSMPSRLVRTLGVYKLVVKNATLNTKTIGWVLLMENLGFGVNPKAVAYDLKGTLNSRRYVKEGEKQTKMDLNFIEDMGALPLLIDFETMSRLHSSIWNDTLFLYKQNVIDYSLVVLVSEEDCQIAAGIIDYLRQYTFDKAIESKYKKVIANELPTITNPVEYKDRFRTQVMQDYFLTLDRR